MREPLPVTERGFSRPISVASMTSPSRGPCCPSPGNTGGRYIGCADGFSAPGYAFDAVAAAVPDVHGHHKARNPDLTAVTYIVFLVAYACEFWGAIVKMSPYPRIHLQKIPQLENSPGGFVEPALSWTSMSWVVSRCRRCHDT